MPPTTKHREPVIVYLPTDTKRELERRAQDEDRSLSRTAARLLVQALGSDSRLKP